MDRMKEIEEIPQRRHVKEASIEGFKAAVDMPTIRDRFTWESDTLDEAWLHFHGTHQQHFRRRDEAQNFFLTQDVWFEFSPALQSLKYVVRLVDHPEGDSRAIFEAVVSLEEGADLLEMCIEQVLAEQALHQARHLEQVALLSK